MSAFMESIGGQADYPEIVLARALTTVSGRPCTRLQPHSPSSIFTARKCTGCLALPGMTSSRNVLRWYCLSLKFTDLGRRDRSCWAVVLCCSQMSKDDPPGRRHPNVAQRRALKAAELAMFVQAAGRPAQKRTEPNDRRRVDLALQRKLRRVPPVELDRLLRHDEED